MSDPDAMRREMAIAQQIDEELAQGDVEVVRHIGEGYRRSVMIGAFLNDRYHIRERRTLPARRSPILNGLHHWKEAS
jgi:hypothetical protein